MSDRECRGMWDRIADRLAGELSEEEAVRLEEHLCECPSCLALERDLRARLDSMRDLGRTTWSASGRGAGDPLDGGEGLREGDDRLGLPRLEARILRAFRAEVAAARESEGGGQEYGGARRSLRSPSTHQRREERDGAGLPSRGFIEMLLRPVPVYAALVLIAVACLSGIWIGHRDGSVAQRVPPIRPRSTAPEASRSPGLANRQDTTGAWSAGWISGKESRYGRFQITLRDAVSLAGALGRDTL